MSKKESQSAPLIWRTLHYYFWQLKKNLQYVIPLLILAPVAIVCNNYLSTFLLAEIINNLTTGLEVTWVNYAPWIVAYIVVMIVGELICWRLVVWLVWRLETRVVYGLNRAAFEALAEQSMSFHNNRFGGSLVSQTNRFSGGYVRIADTTIFSLLPLVIGLVSIFVVLGPRLPVFTLILGIFAAIFMTVAYLSYRKTLKLTEAEASAQTKLSGKLADSISNIVTVKSYGRETFEKERFALANKKVQNATFALIRAIMTRDLGFSSVIVSMSALVAITIVFGQGWFGVPLGTLILAMQYGQLLLGDLWSSNRILRDYNRALGDAREMTEILDTQMMVADKPSAKSIVVTEGQVDFDNITFSHADAPEEDLVFENFSLHIKPGQRVGLVGRSGSGKTTLTKLLLRFADVNSGEILIDGQNISYVTQVSLREKIAYVPQETTLFHRTIRENIAYGRPEATDAEVERAAELANALEFIVKLPEGFNTLTGERGVKLSGGQRQRIAIARAILKDAPILVLDEATSALDSESEKLIQDALQKLMRGRTCLVIAHRLSTVANLDRIIVLENGKIVEDGTHAELIKSHGEYAQLWNRQTGAFIEAVEVDED